MQDPQHSHESQPARFQCRHILTSGHRCRSVCLRNEEFCYFHHTSRVPIRNPRQRKARRASRSSFDLPLAGDQNDRGAIQIAIALVLRRIASNEIDSRRAGLLLYGLQIASITLPRVREAAPQPDPQESTIEEISLHPVLGPIAPRTNYDQSPNGKKDEPVALVLMREWIEELDRREREGSDKERSDKERSNQERSDKERSNQESPRHNPPTHAFSAESAPAAQPATLPTLQACAEPALPLSPFAFLLSSFREAEVPACELQPVILSAAKNPCIAPLQLPVLLVILPLFCCHPSAFFVVILPLFCCHPFAFFVVILPLFLLSSFREAGGPAVRRCPLPLPLLLQLSLSLVPFLLSSFREAEVPACKLQPVILSAAKNPCISPLRFARSARDPSAFFLSSFREAGGPAVCRCCCCRRCRDLYLCSHSSAKRKDRSPLATSRKLESLSALQHLKCVRYDWAA